MSAELRLLDDDFDIEKCMIEACEKELKSLAKEMIKRRIVTMPKIYVVSTAFNKNDFLSAFKHSNLHDHIVDTFNYAVFTCWDFGTYYKPLKRRLTHGRRGSIKKFKLH